MLHARTVWIAAALLGALAAPAAAERYAVVVGINSYPGAALRGCLNDARNVNQMLGSRFHFASGNVQMLLDRDATRNGILRALDGATARLRSGDVLVFYYSGHGTIFPDENSEEQDETVVLQPNQFVPRPGKYDSAICPIDCRDESGKPWRGLILDDELFAVFGRAVERGAFVVAFYDSCHSGSMARDLGFAVKAMTPEKALGIPLDRIPAPAQQRVVTHRDLRGLYLAFGGSKDDQTSKEYRDGSGQPCGLFTLQLLQAVERTSRASGLTYRSVYDTLSREVSRIASTEIRDPQEPQADTRFFAGSLESAMFEPLGVAPGPLPPGPGPAPAFGDLRVVVRVQDGQGRALRDAFFCVFRPGARPAKGQIRAEDALVLGKTDAKGLYDSGARSVRPGVYRVKCVKEGFRVFEQEMEIRPGTMPGTAVLTFRLQPEL